MLVFEERAEVGGKDPKLLVLFAMSHQKNKDDSCKKHWCSIMHFPKVEDRELVLIEVWWGCLLITACFIYKHVSEPMALISENGITCH